MKYLTGTVYAEADIKLVHNFGKSVIGLCVIGPCEDEQMLISVTSLNVFPSVARRRLTHSPVFFPSLFIYRPFFPSLVYHWAADAADAGVELHTQQVIDGETSSRPRIFCCCRCCFFPPHKGHGG